MPRDPVNAILIETDDPVRTAEARALARELGLSPAAATVGGGGGLRLAMTATGLELRDGADPSGPGVRVDFGAMNLRPDAETSGERQPLARAVGRRNRTVLDATAGLGRDAALLAAMGYHVTAVERSPVVAALLRDGLRRATADPRCREALADRLVVLAGDARDVLTALDEAPDVVYLDPMYPAGGKASALPKKRIRLVRRVVGEDADADALLETARGRSADRVVVKRPVRARRAAPITGTPSFTIDGKLARYDVYLTRTTGEPGDPRAGR